MHLFHPSIIRAYDIRGVFEKTLFANDAYFLAKSFSKFLVDQSPKKVAIGFDGRLTSPILRDNLVKGFVESGVEVIEVGLCPTPMLYFAIHHLDCDAGIMITGSHNPKNHNGFKIALKDKPFFGDDIKKLAEIAKEGDFIEGNGSCKKIDIEDDYILRILQDIEESKLKINDLKIAWDCGNGATGNVIRKITNKINSTNYLIYDEIDGNFPNHHPDPTEEKNLQDLIKLVHDNKCDIGLAFDGDGDRIGVVDDQGQIIWGDQLMVFFAQDVLQGNKGAKIIADVKASNILFSEIAKAGGIPVMWKTGHSLIKSKMKIEKSPLAGEMSGHIFFADKYYGYDDAIYAAIRVINLILKTGKKLSELRKSIPKTYSTPEIRIDCDDDKKFAIIDLVKEKLNSRKQKFIDVDGVRYVDGDNWWLLRASNTQPVLVARCESTSESDLKKVKNDFCDILQDLKIEIPNELK